MCNYFDYYQYLLILIRGKYDKWAEGYFTSLDNKCCIIYVNFQYLIDSDY